MANFFQLTLTASSVLAVTGQALYHERPLKPLASVMEPEGSTSYPSLVALGLSWRELLTELSRATVLKALESLTCSL